MKFADKVHNLYHFVFKDCTSVCKIANNTLANVCMLMLLMHANIYMYANVSMLYYANICSLTVAIVN
jgi:hypothetical protein